jgi:hypothetical protein
VTLIRTGSILPTCRVMKRSISDSARLQPEIPNELHGLGLQDDLPITTKGLEFANGDRVRIPRARRPSRYPEPSRRLILVAGIASSAAKRALVPSASSIRSASFHFAMRSDREKEPTLSWPAPQPIAR